MMRLISSFMPLTRCALAAPLVFSLILPAPLQAAMPRCLDGVSVGHSCYFSISSETRSLSAVNAPASLVSKPVLSPLVELRQLDKPLLPAALDPLAKPAEITAEPDAAALGYSGLGALVHTYIGDNQTTIVDLLFGLILLSVLLIFMLIRGVLRFVLVIQGKSTALRD